MGIGIPSITSLSKDGVTEFRSVNINSKGQEEGLVATYVLEDDDGGFVIRLNIQIANMSFQKTVCYMEELA